MYICPKRIPTAQGCSDAINGLFVFCFKGAKPFIPNNKHARMVSVYILSIDGMVYAVMRGCIPYGFYPSRQFADGFGMNPKLV